MRKDTERDRANEDDSRPVKYRGRRQDTKSERKYDERRIRTQIRKQVTMED